MTEMVFHPLFADFMKQNKPVEHFVGSNDLTVEEHMEVQRIVQKHVDNAVSKTINMSEDYSMEDMSKVWLDYLPELKGTTFYREGSRKFIMPDGSEQEPPLKAIPIDEAIQRFRAESSQAVAPVDDCASGLCEL